MAIADLIKEFGPSIYPRLNEASGTSWNDSSGNGRTSTGAGITGSFPTAGGLSPYSTADANSAIRSAGFTRPQSIAFPAGSYLNQTVFSMCALVRGSVFGSNSTAIASFRSSSPAMNGWQWGSAQTTGVTVWFVWDTAGTVIVNPTGVVNICDTNWHFVGASYSQGVSFNTYVDSTHESTGVPSTGTTGSGSSTPLTIGCDGTTNARGWTGNIAEFAYFGGQLLTPDQMLALYKEWRRGGVVM